MPGGEVNPARIRRRLERLAEVGRDPAGGWTRFAFTEEDARARELVMGFMREAGLTVRVDAAGNIFGRREGRRAVPPVASGSHLDTVKNGGMFDGTVGVVCALEVAQALAEEGVEHEVPYEVVVFADEEGGRFGSGFLGSRALVGEVTPQELRQRRDKDGITPWEAMERFGLRPGEIASARAGRGRFASFWEVHVEQGPVLETSGRKLGVVEGIVGLAWLRVRLAGRAGHAGAMPMALRQDALAGAAEAVLAVERIAREASPAAVATVGELEAKPGAINVIPGEVEFTVDLRELRDAVVEEMVTAVRREVAAICARRGLSGEVRETARAPAARLATGCVRELERVCQDLSLPYLRLSSGAGHDSQIVSRIAEVGMLFVPSQGGISHSPEEKTSWEDITLGARVLLETVRRRIQPLS